ncbi:Flagellum-specific ATP synthase [Rhodovastum atsumiense]|uniref:Flagellum-specific ATP synthase n=1 Tax=Rhodovastum atsumiense TaxID=504468 RepID=A0A5M6IQM1_9PROT|nr:flagellar protein export ATPase FliI [Rhodovastum atsumiense]KAA5610227.1 flagellar protein export ATPase FliI [Rhodovastum atsumiense]CAH2604155.1 Flagellum-specific ATP synthase [Rhodovastum atsumiense]
MRRASLAQRSASALAALHDIPPTCMEGRIVGVSGLAVEIGGLSHHLSVGDRLSLSSRNGRQVAAEIVGFRGGLAQAMTYGPADGLGPGAAARGAIPHPDAPPGPTLAVDDSWIGRVIDPLGRPLDGRGKLARGPAPRPVRAAPPDATRRARLGERLDLGVRVLNAFTTCRRGQRLGLFAASGVGKSTLLAMLARHTACDVAVLALVGERGREVREFIEDDLGRQGLARAVVVVATSDTPPLLRREAAHTAMTVAEHFRDQGKSVLLLMDSVTRFCLALREIGLSAGEPPATRGFPPSVFAELPRLLERAGPGPDIPGRSAGHITGLFTVLVEGDDHDEPVADAVRGILDGHVILDRRIAEGGRYPAVDVLRSLSRAVPGCNGAEENALTRRARAILKLHADMADLVRLGAYRAGTDPAVDEAIAVAPRIEALLRQGRDERTGLADSFAQLRTALEAPVS